MSDKRLLIAVDLDGTLLTDKKKITTRTKKTLQEARRQGHEVVIATGRPYRASKDYYHCLELDSPIVNFNGALVHHPQREDWGIFHSPLHLDVAQTIIDSSQKFGVQNIIAEVTDEVFVKKAEQVLRNGFFDPTLNIQPLPQKLVQRPTSLMIHPYEHNVSELRRHLEENHAEVIEHRKWGAPWHVIEIVRAGLNKAVGLERICRHYGIPVQNVIAFGDEDNDLEMIEFAGTGVAMDNAIDKLKEKADAITETNEEEGIAHFLEEHVL